MGKHRKLFAHVALACALGLTGGLVHADGSVSFAQDILPLMKERPTFERFIRETFKVTDTGWGVRIGNEAMPHLGGARMGPYQFQARWLSPAGEVPVTLVIDTEAHFFDRAGRDVTDGDLAQATSLKETFTSIEIEPPK